MKFLFKAIAFAVLGMAVLSAIALLIVKYYDYLSAAFDKIKEKFDSKKYVMFSDCECEDCCPEEN